MAKFWADIKFGCAFGIGLILAFGVLRLILWLINMIASGAHGPIDAWPK